MRIVRTASEFKRDRSKTVGFVPTMGAFHEGHLSLMRRAKAENDVCAVSIFVNPTQFIQGEDFAKYPRDFERDASLAESAGVDVLFAPDVEDMYPRKTTAIIVSGLTDRWEGAHRPGHFDGVATVVTKLFNIAQADVAYFGLKDLQQCLVIERMVADLNQPIELRFSDTIRESDGLAMSSRNAYLSAESRLVAPNLYREICQVRDAALRDLSTVDSQIVASSNRLIECDFKPDYLELVDLETLAPTRESVNRCAVIVAAKLGTTRLIDNVRINM